jgi:hypothetical protein
MTTADKAIRDKIADLFESYHYQTLLQMAEWAGMTVKQNGRKLNRDALIRRMGSEFFTPERVLASWEALDERERAVLDRLMLRNGPVRLTSFRREILRAKLAFSAPKPVRERGYSSSSVPYADGYIGHPGRQGSTILEDLLARLTTRGLVFSRTEASNMGGQPFKLQAHPAAVLYIPELVRQALPEPGPISADTPSLELDEVRRGSPELLLRDLYLYWDVVRRHPVKTIQSGLVGKRWLKVINQELLQPDPGLKGARNEREIVHLYLLRQLLQGLKLIRRRGKRLVVEGQDPASIPEFWSLPPAAQANACLQAWSRLAEPLNPDTEVTRYYPDYAGARRTILDALQDLPSRVWMEPIDFLDRVQNRDANFLFADHTSVESFRGAWYHSYGRAYYSDRTQDLLRAFEEAETRYVQALLQGILFQLGIVELGYKGEEWVAFRLSRDLAATQQGSGPNDSKIIVQPNFQVMAMGPVPLNLLAYLDLFAERERVDLSVFEYRLSRESVYRGQQAGIDTAEIICFLEEGSDVPLPQNVRRSLEEWAAHHERIVFRSGVSLVQARDGELLDRLAAEPAIGGHLGRKLSPEVALISKDTGAALVAALVARDYLPAVSGVEPQAADKSVIVHADGRIQPIHAVPSLHLRGRLVRLAERGGDGQWRLTAASIGRAGGSRKKVERILDDLGRMHRGTLPRELVERVKGWGAYYGDAAVETLTLVEFRDKAALEELRQRPQLKSILRPFAAGNRALAVVPSERLEELRSILDCLGVRIRDRLGVADSDSRPENADDT